ncbi:family 20 glycosylhydrolase [Adhaeribacter radiodurans]|uniref:beta-N-acetylhexosaminidase n=1 Tax=Adhaeribacter radiodurans TaxID=2745197 RepID=A0A7L7L1U7_9BACT|nr:family 20 glycosylhydrolase [Adhaeribacter radiodurans]QMU26754.1 carbohydate-binding domain-containing protein [Adhaeribacter radiodurans]
MFLLINQRIKFLLVVLAAILSVSVTAWSQAPAFDAKKLLVSWEVNENNYQNKAQFLSTIILNNGAPQALPTSGWKIYFNYNRSIISGSVRGAVTLQHLNGDLFQITPKADFKRMSSGAIARISFVTTGAALNITDAPSGFYLVWDKSPNQGLALSPVKVKVPTATKPSTVPGSPAITLINPEALYQQNKPTPDIAAEKLPKIFPTPANYRETEASFALTADIPIITATDYYPEAEMLAEDLAAIFGKKTEFKNTGSGKAIRLVKKEDLAPEAYDLRVTSQEIVINASTPAGMFYGMQSLKTLLPANAWELRPKSVTIPGVEVSDYPRFDHRAVMLDVARNFQSKKQVLKLLDLMALYKLNVLHFHFNDDEGWRVEIVPLPELTEIGGKRAHTLDSRNNLPPSYGSGPIANNLPGSGYYTRSDFIQILKYARDRNIKVIPEIETPGHARAAIKAMDIRYSRLMAAGKKEDAERYLLRDLNDKSEYQSVQNWNDNVINVALPSVYNFLEKVVDEVRDMYQEAGAPLQTIHFGGDEVPTGVWVKSPVVQKLLQEDERFTSVDDMWYYYFRKVNEILKIRNLYLSGWEEVAMRKTEIEGQKHYIPNPDFVNENIHVDVWNNTLGGGSEDLAYRLANAGYKVILSNVTNQYFDMAYNSTFEEPGFYWGSFVDVDKPFYFIPYNYYKNTKKDKFGNPLPKSVFAGKERLTDFGKNNIVGIQGLLWAETIITPERMEYMILPKLLGLAERAWSPDPDWAVEKDTVKSEALYQQAWARFANILGKRELPRLDYYSGGYQYRLPPVGAVVQNGQVSANIQLPGLTIRYTTDGTDPTFRSRIYREPITETGTVKLRAVSRTGRGGKVVTLENK